MGVVSRLWHDLLSGHSGSWAAAAHGGGAAGLPHLLRTVVSVSVLAGLPTTCYLAANTMADTKGANISRMVLKQAGRAKEKVGTGRTKRGALSHSVTM